MIILVLNLVTSLWIMTGLIACATIIGFLLRKTQTRIRSVRGANTRPDHVVEPWELAAAGAPAPAFGARATLVQFSTTHCARCPSTARVLQAATRRYDGVTHVEVDVSDRDDLITRFGIFRTPTVLVIDHTQRVTHRASGPLSPDDAGRLLAPFATAPHAPSGHVALQTGTHS